MPDNTLKSARDPFDGCWHIYVDRKSYGPYAGHHIRTMVAASEVLGTDLVCSDGGTAWIQAKDDPVLRLLFLENSTSKPSPRGPTAKRGRQVNRGAGVFILFLLCWLVWPYFAFYELSTAVRDGDVTALESRINWESVRQGLRADLNMNFLKDTTKGQSDFGKGLAVLFGPALISQMVDGYVTPQTIGNLIRNGKPKLTQLSAEAAPQQSLAHGKLKYAFFDRGPFSFRVDLQPDGDKSGMVTLIFTWRGDWKVTRLVLPLDEIQAANEKPSLPQALDASTATSPQSPDALRVKAKTADNSATWGLMFQSQVQRCWKKPHGKGSSPPEAAFSIRLNADGTLQGSPVPEKSPTSPFGRAYQDSALRAIIGCQPYSLPAAHFDEWKYFAPVFTEQRNP
jgi:hypothetical protein